MGVVMKIILSKGVVEKLNLSLDVLYTHIFVYMFLYKHGHEYIYCRHD